MPSGESGIGKGCHPPVAFPPYMAAMNAGCGGDAAIRRTPCYRGIDTRVECCMEECLHVYIAE